MTLTQGDRATTDNGYPSRSLEEGLRLASHEIRQPIATILALAQAAQLHPEVTPPLENYLKQIAQEALQVSETARAALDIDHHRPVQRHVVNVDEIVDDVLESFRITWTGTIHRSGETNLFVIGDASLLRGSLINVVENGSRAAGPEGTLRVDVRCRDGQVVLEVEDDGPGMGGIASGTRIGLSFSRRALQSMGGGLRVGVGDSGGVRVRLAVPWMRSA